MGGYKVTVDKRCKCTMAQSLTGDVCRYCQPQEYIDRLEAELDELREKIENLENIIDEQSECGYEWKWA